MRTIRAEIRRLHVAGDGRAVRRGQGAAGAVRPGRARSPTAGKLPVVLFTAGGIATPADAAMMMQLGAEGVFVGSGIFKSGNPAAAGRGDRQGHHVLRRPRRDRQGLPRARRGDGRHQRRRRSRSRTGSPSAAGEPPPTVVGVLALQGDVREHLRGADRAAAPTRVAGAPPGGARRASTGWSCPAASRPRCASWPRTFDLLEPLRAAARGRAAGVRHLRRDDPARRPDRGRRRRPGDDRRARRRRCAATRSAGRSTRSRPTSTSRGSTAARCTRCSSGRPGSRRSGPASRCSRASTAGRPPVGSSRSGRGRLLATSFHPELTGDPRVHRLFVDLVRRRTSTT